MNCIDSRDALGQARTCPPDQRTTALTTAVGLYTGPYLPGAGYDWARNAAHALDRDVIDALTQLALAQRDRRWLAALQTGT